MYTKDALIDIHTRTQGSFAKILGHLAGLSEPELDRVFDGFGTGSLRQQVYHMIGAEEYWMGVVRGKVPTEERPEDFASLPALSAYRERIAAATVELIRGMTDAELNTRRSMTVWGGAVHELAPAHIVMRTQTHIFQHIGQVTAIVRLLGKPVPPGFDFSVR